MLLKGFQATGQISTICATRNRAECARADASSRAEGMDGSSGCCPRRRARLPIAWWVLLLLRGILPAVFAIAMGMLVGAVQRGDSLAGPLTFVGVVFVLLQILTPVHQAVSANLGDRTAAWLYDRLTEACVRPPGMGHLEDPEAHERPDRRARLRPRHDRPAAVDLDGLHRRRPGPDRRRIRLARSCCSRTPGGRRSCWPARGWRRTGCCARAAVWQDRNTEEVRAAQRDADYAYRLAVDPPGEQGTAAVRSGGLDDRSLRRAPHASARSAVRGDTPARAADAVERRCWSSSPTSWCSGRWRAPPPTAGSRSGRSSRSSRAPSACR